MRKLQTVLVTSSTVINKQNVVGDTSSGSDSDTSLLEDGCHFPDNVVLRFVDDQSTHQLSNKENISKQDRGKRKKPSSHIVNNNKRSITKNPFK